MNIEEITLNRIEDHYGLRQCEVVGAERVTVRYNPLNEAWDGFVDGALVSYGVYANVAAARALSAVVQA